MTSDSGTTTGAELSPGRYGIIALALATAIIHIVLAVPLTLIGFYLNGLGYIVLVTACFLPQLHTYHRLVRWLLMGYTALTILLWVVLGQPYNAIGYVDKAIELALLGLLWREQRWSAGSDSGCRLVNSAQEPPHHLTGGTT